MAEDEKDYAKEYEIETEHTYIRIIKLPKEIEEKNCSIGDPFYQVLTSFQRKQILDLGDGEMYETDVPGLYLMLGGDINEYRALAIKKVPGAMEKAIILAELFKDIKPEMTPEGIEELIKKIINKK